jgi:AcrR family transcriptional regulator
MPTDTDVVGEAHDWRAYNGLALHPILEASLAALQENGYHGTTVRDIARRVGLTMPALYYHYGNKEGILMALLDVAMDDLISHVEGGIADGGDDVEQKLANIVTAVVMHQTRRGRLAKLHPEYRFLGPEGRNRYVEKRARVYAALVGVLEEGAKSGLFDIRDSHKTSRAILGMLQSIVDWYREDGPESPEQVAEAHRQLVSRMVRPAASDVAAPKRTRRRAAS